jgi:hypothetical protein
MHLPWLEIARQPLSLLDLLPRHLIFYYGHIMPCIIIHGIPGISKSAEFLHFKRRALSTAECTTDSSCAFRYVPRCQRLTSLVVEHTRYNSSRKRRQLNQPATTTPTRKDPFKIVRLILGPGALCNSYLPGGGSGALIDYAASLFWRHSL